MVLSCAGVYTALPQRLAGTASQYSKNAMPQLTITASGSQLSLNFKWPYHANVMKTLEANSIRTGNSDGGMARIDILSQLGANTIGGESPGGPLPRQQLTQQIRKPRRPDQSIF